MRWFWIAYVACLMAGAAWGQDAPKPNILSALTETATSTPVKWNIGGVALVTGECFRVMTESPLSAEKIDCPAKADSEPDENTCPKFRDVVEWMKSAARGEPGPAWVKFVPKGCQFFVIMSALDEEQLGKYPNVNPPKSEPKETPATKHVHDESLPAEMCMAYPDGSTGNCHPMYETATTYSCPSQGTWVMETDVKGGTWCR